MTSTPANSRSQAMARVPSGLAALAGFWLIMAPFVLGYSTLSQALWNDLLVGAAILIVGLMRLAKPGQWPGLSWVNMLLGAWLIVAPFILLYTTREIAATPAAAASDTATVNDIVVGMVVLALAAWSARASRAPAGGAEGSLGRTTASTAERGGPNV